MGLVNTVSGNIEWEKEVKPGRGIEPKYITANSKYIIFQDHEDAYEKGNYRNYNPAFFIADLTGKEIFRYQIENNRFKRIKLLIKSNKLYFIVDNEIQVFYIPALGVQP